MKSCGKTAKEEMMELNLSKETKDELIFQKKKLKIELARLEETRDALDDEIDILSKLSDAIKTIIEYSQKEADHEWR